MVGRQVKQLTGHLKGKALHEWKLLTSKHKISYYTAVIKALTEKLDQTLAALGDFQQTTQKTDEPVSDFIGCLEKIFRLDLAGNICLIKPKTSYCMVYYRKVY